MTLTPQVSPGRVVFIGAGPGAADLITLRGANRLATANVVLFDALTDPALRRLAPQARWLNVGKRGFDRATEQATINQLLVRMAQQHAVVVRLKGGDPSVFGRLEEELQALAAAGISAEVVPGITAALAAAADTQRPLTRRGQGRSVALTTAVGQHARASDACASDSCASNLRAPSAGTSGLQATAQLSPHADTEVFYMAGKQLPGLARVLLQAGWPASTACVVVSRAGWPDSLASPHSLADLASAALLHAGRPTVVTVGVGAAPVLAPVATGEARQTLRLSTARNPMAGLPCASP
jgi:uroporphyrin-III C-methyltransferase